MTVLRELIDKLFYGGYQAADKASTARVVVRFARGNTSIQLGRYMTVDDAEKLHKRGDKAAKRLRNRIARAIR